MAPVALAQGVHQFRGLFPLLDVEPLLELIENDKDFLPCWDALSTPQCRQRVLQAQVVGQLRAMLPQTTQEPVVRLPSRRLDVNWNQMMRKPGQQSRLHQRRLAAAGRSVDQPHRKGPVGVHFLDAVLPETDAVGQPFPIPSPGQQFQEEIGILRIERPQPFRNDLDGRGLGRRCCRRRVGGNLGFGGQRFLSRWNRRGNIVQALSQEMPQIVGQVFRCQVPLCGPFRQRPQADAFQFLWNRIVGLTKRFGLQGGDLVHQFSYVICPEGTPPGQQLVEDDPQAENVASPINAMAFPPSLLRAHIRRSAASACPLAHILLSQGQPEIGNERLAAAIQQDIGRLDVPMDKPSLMGIVQGFGNGHYQFHGLGKPQTGLFDLGSQTGSVDELANDIDRKLLRGANVVHRDDVRVVEIGDRAGFGQVRLGVLRAKNERGMRHLDGDGPVQLLVVGQIDQSETALAQEPFHPVAADPFRLLGQRGLIKQGGPRGSMLLGLSTGCVSVGSHHSIVNCLKLFRQIGMNRPEGVQILGRSWPITVAASGVILAKDQITGELFDRAEQRIAGNVVRQPWPWGKRKAAFRHIGASRLCVDSSGLPGDRFLLGRYACCLPTAFEVDADELYQEVTQRCPALVRRLGRQEVLDSRLLAGLPDGLESGASISDQSRLSF